MKLVKNITLHLLVCLLLAFAVTQTRWAKGKMKAHIARLSAEKNIALSFDELEEWLPFKWTLTNVTISVGGGKSVFAKKVLLRLSYFPFCVTSIDLIDGNYCGLPFSLMAKGEFSNQCEISTFHIDNQLFHLTGSASLSSLWDPLKAECLFHIPDLAQCHPQLQGSLQGKVQVLSETAHLALDFHEVKVGEFSLGALNADFLASLNETGWKGNFVFNSEAAFEGALAFQFDPQTSLLHLDQIDIQGPESRLYGELAFNPFSLDWQEGQLYLNALRLEQFRSIVPDAFLKGAANAHIQFFPENRLHVHGNVERLSVYSLYLQSAQFNLVKNGAGALEIEGQQLQLPQGSFSTFKLHSLFDQEKAPFSFIATGDPLNIDISGNWHQKEQRYAAMIENLKGDLFKAPYHLEKQVELEWDEGHFKMSPLVLNSAEGHLLAHIELLKDQALVTIEGVKWPLHFVSLFQKDFSFDGTADFSCNLSHFNDHLTGAAALSFQQVDLISDAKKETIQLSGSMEAQLNEKEAKISGKVETPCGQHLLASATFPILFNSYPWMLISVQDSPFSAQLEMQGKLQDLFQFINIGDQQLEGWLSCHLQFSNSLQTPVMQGTLELQEGSYENLTLGLTLKNVEACALAQDQEIKVVTFKATDESQGSMSGSGIMKLGPQQPFSYAIDSHLNQFQAISLDTLDGKFTGHLLFTGGRHDAKAQGNLIVSEARFKIPEKLPPVIPDLEIQLINTPESLLKKPLKPLSLFPIHLDLELDAANHVFLEWKGLSSEWHGNLHVKGTHLNVQAKGALSLIKGDYNFASKTFSLSEGKMTFNDQSSPAMYLSLSGACELADTNVKVLVRGPLFSPTLTFQSNPTMATSALLSRILFNKDITDISTVQAFQLAQTLLSLSGDATPNILDRIRKTLFIDRLNLTTTEDDEILLQVSKSLTKGVMFTFSRGIDTQKATVDVELNPDFLFQAEVGKNQKGKFSLKWNHNYH